MSNSYLLQTQVILMGLINLRIFLSTIISLAIEFTPVLSYLGEKKLLADIEYRPEKSSREEDDKLFHLS